MDNMNMCLEPVSDWVCSTNIPDDAEHKCARCGSGLCKHHAQIVEGKPYCHVCYWRHDRPVSKLPQASRGSEPWPCELAEVSRG